MSFFPPWYFFISRDGPLRASAGNLRGKSLLLSVECGALRRQIVLECCLECYEYGGFFPQNCFVVVHVTPPVFFIYGQWYLVLYMYIVKKNQNLPSSPGLEDGGNARKEPNQHLCSG